MHYGKRGFLRAGIAGILILTLFAGMISGCRKSLKDTDTDAKKVEDTEKKTKKTEDPAASSDPEAGGEPIDVSAEELSGLWLDEHGPYMSVDTKENTITLLREMAVIQITEIDASGIRCVIDKNNKFAQSSGELENPFLAENDEVYFPIEMRSGGYMEFLGLPLFRNNSDEGQALGAKLDEVLFKKTFTYGDLRDYADMDFGMTFAPNSAAMQTKDGEETFQAGCKDGVAEITNFGTSIVLCAYLPDPQKDDVILMYTAPFLSSCETSAVELELKGTTWIVPDPQGNSIETWKMNDQDELVAYDYAGKELGTHTVSTYSQDAIFLDDGGENLYASSLGAGWLLGRSTRDTETILLPSWSLNGLLYSYREAVRSGEKKNVIFTDKDYNYGKNDEKIKVVVDLGGKAVEDVWLPDYAKASVIMEGYSWDNTILSSHLFIVTGPDFVGAEVTMAVATDVDPSHIAIICTGSDDPTTSCDGRITKSGNMVTAEFKIRKSGIYCLENVGSTKAKKTFFDVPTLLATDPKDTFWATSYNTGDILSLLDLEYIRNSIIDEETGSAEFWVSTPEQLASVCYYVNALDVEYGTEVSTMYYVHLLNDIDLTGYEWAPMGHPSYDRGGMDVETCFRGVIFGNGYSIRGLHIRNQDSAFLGSCHLTTVIGLTLDHPSFEISNPNRPVNCLCDNDCCITEFFDCEVIIDPSQEGTYEFSSTINGSVNYFDCRFRSDDGNQSKDIGLKSDYVQDFYNGYDNWIRRYYRQSDGTYRYDAASEYEDFLSDTAKFTDMRYYYGGVEAEPYVGYINFHGWIINGEFYINFGYIYEK